MSKCPLASKVHENLSFFSHKMKTKCVLLAKSWFRIAQRIRKRHLMSFWNLENVLAGMTPPPAASDTAFLDLPMFVLFTYSSAPQVAADQVSGVKMPTLIKHEIRCIFRIIPHKMGLAFVKPTKYTIHSSCTIPCSNCLLSPLGLTA